jgi:uncharacterized membrane protein
MSEHERTIIVQVPSGEAFHYLSSVSNLPEFVPHLSEIREDEENHVRGTVDVGGGHRQEVSGFFRADHSNLRLDWESDGTPGYRGWLRIVPENGDSSRITVHISMQGAASEEAPREAGLAGDRMERGFDSVMREVERVLTGKTAPTRSAI